MKKKIAQNNNFIIYQTKSGALELKGDFNHDTVWATQAQIAEIFGIERSVITKHIKNIYKEKELKQISTCAKIAQVQIEGKRQVERIVENYNLDVIISVGYRINSKIATEFRQWATKTLKNHITKGYTINKKVVSKNWEEFANAVEVVKKVLPKEYQVLSHTQTLDLISFFAHTWLSLDAYDKSELKISRVTKKKVHITASDLSDALNELKQRLILKGEATELFGKDRNRESLEGIVGNVLQSFSGVDVYESIEAKAAHVLYFIVKNHPFTDGNKRSGAFAFVWFLEKTNRLDTSRISPEALTAITLLVAESNPNDKENIIALIMKLIESK